ncbi:MAG TPA: helix-turn-helix transcriptional regulator [Candidatus Paceibacterota bacterium]
MKMITLKQLKKKLFKDPAVKKAYDDLGPEFEILSLLIRKRIEEGLTQKQLAKKLKTKQSAISRFESGRYNPTLEFLRNMANALGADIKFSITPRS